MAITSNYTKTLLIGDMTMATTVTLPAGEYVPLMKFQVPFKNQYFVGNGTLYLGNDTRGTFKLDVQTTAPANIPGVSRLRYADANLINSTFLREDISADAVSGVKVGIGGQTGLEKPLTGVGERSYIFVDYATITAAVATVADSSIQLPVTINALS